MANIREAIGLYVENPREVGQFIPADPELGALQSPSPAVAVSV